MLPVDLCRKVVVQLSCRTAAELLNPEVAHGVKWGERPRFLSVVKHAKGEMR